jgi:hypothetical protein
VAISEPELADMITDRDSESRFAEVKLRPQALQMVREPEPEREAEPRNPAPWLSDLPLDFQTRTALGSITVFAYADAPRDRFIIMDKVKYAIGQQIKQNAVIVDILSTYVLLQFEGQSFKLARP